LLVTSVTCSAPLAAFTMRARAGHEFWCESPLDQSSNEIDAENAMAMATGTPYAEIVRTLVTIADSLPAILTGRRDAVESFFANGSSEMMAKAYGEIPEAEYSIKRLANVLASLLAQSKQERVLRIMEVGAGTGATTRTLLPVLPAERAWYLFTDVSDYFLQEARSSFGQRPSFHCAWFDLNGAPQRSAVASGRLDVIVAANALHCAASIGRTLEYLRTLLKPGGLLVLLEATTNHLWHLISLGLLKGYMAFEDERVSAHAPLLSVTEWQRSLRSSGFHDVVCSPEDDARSLVVGQHVIIARV
jgi:trans-aconitate methyltransferase